jgi:hypothetical protein
MGLWTAFRPPTAAPSEIPDAGSGPIGKTELLAVCTDRVAGAAIPGIFSVGPGLHEGAVRPFALTIIRPWTPIAGLRTNPKEGRMLKKLGLGLLVVVGALAAVIATRPGEFKVQRTASIAAPAEVVFGYLNDFHNWAKWSPWEKRDPNMKKTFEGSPSGAGAIYSWVGNDQVGEGRMTLTESKPGERVLIKLEFIKPFAATNQTEIALAAAGGTTNVTWTMTGTSNFIGKAFSLVMNMDKLVGGDFEKGLANLKQQSEQEAKRLADEAAKAKAAPPVAAAPAAP